MAEIFYLLWENKWRFLSPQPACRVEWQEKRMHGKPRLHTVGEKPVSSKCSVLIFYDSALKLSKVMHTYSTGKLVFSFKCPGKELHTVLRKGFYMYFMFQVSSKKIIWNRNRWMTSNHLLLIIFRLNCSIYIKNSFFFFFKISILFLSTWWIKYLL